MFYTHPSEALYDDDAPILLTLYKGNDDDDDDAPLTTSTHEKPYYLRSTCCYPCPLNLITFFSGYAIRGRTDYACRKRAGKPPARNPSPVKVSDCLVLSASQNNLLKLDTAPRPPRRRD